MAGVLGWDAISGGRSSGGAAGAISGGRSSGGAAGAISQGTDPETDGAGDRG
jgi:hypothetical protein